MKKGAIISDCNQYRYKLYRTWNEDLPKVIFMMLNPSTADAMVDDPTIRRCIGFAKSNGYGGIIIGNLFAYRTSNPKELLSVKDPIGNRNKHYLKEIFSESNHLICAWGNSGIVDKLIAKTGMDYKPLSDFKGELMYLELSQNGTPKHPLYLKKDLKPSIYTVTSILDVINYHVKSLNV